MAKSKAISKAKIPMTVKSFLSKDRISDSEDGTSTTNENEKDPKKTNGVSQKSRKPQPKNTVPLSKNSDSDSDSDSDSLDASEEEEDKIDKLIPRIPIVSPKTLKDFKRTADGQRSSEARPSGKNIGNAESTLQAKEKDAIETSSDSSSSDSTSEEESENEDTLHSTNLGSVSGNGTSTNQIGRSETTQENEQSSSKNQVPLPPTPKAINVRLMKPPTGYTPLGQAATVRNTTIPDLSGKQIFHVSVPSHLSTVLPTTISGESLSNGALFLRHEGDDFIIRSDEEIGGVPQTLNLLLPSSDVEGTFTFARQTVPQTLHLALHVNLSHLIHKQADALTMGDDPEPDSEHEVADAAQFQLPRNERTETTAMDISDTSETSVESEEGESVPSSSRGKKRKAEERAGGVPSSQKKKRRTDEQAESVPSSRGKKRETEQQAKRKEESGRAGVQRKESSGRAKEDSSTNSVPKKIKNREGGDGKKKAKKKET